MNLTLEAEMFRFIKFLNLMKIYIQGRSTDFIFLAPKSDVTITDFKESAYFK